MIIWVIIILVMGGLISFAPNFLVSNNLLNYTGVIIMLICVGIGIRMLSLRRKGVKEKLAEKIKELEDKLAELKGKPPQS